MAWLAPPNPQPPPFHRPPLRTPHACAPPPCWAGRPAVDRRPWPPAPPPHRQVGTLLRRHGVRERLADALCAQAGVEGRRMCELKKAERQALLELLTAYPLQVTGHEGYKKAEVTGGGVPLSEVDCKSMESRWGWGYGGRGARCRLGAGMGSGVGAAAQQRLQPRPAALPGHVGGGGALPGQGGQAGVLALRLEAGGHLACMPINKP
jgi:hypothetical protein